jgi:large subunit ribosomal protein L4
MKFEKFDLKGKKMETKVTLNDVVWAAPMNEDLLSQALYVYQNNTRTGLAHAKNRADVRGGGRKPWAQKGTGRARAGSIRSPIWRGGGVTFVPNYRNWSKRLNTKMKRAATRIILSKRLADGNIKFVEVAEKVKLTEYRKLITEKGKHLVISDNKNVFFAIRNTEGAQVASSDTVSLYDILKSINIIVDVASIAKLEERLSNVK